jgi:hypothetical protein
MNLSDIKLPRELEADGTAESIRSVLGTRTVQLWPGGDLSVPMITMGEALKKVLRRASLNGQVRWGLEAISHKLKEEERGIANLREGRGLPTGNRVSRLLLFSSDGAQRFYRHIEHLLKAYAPRLFACMLDIDGNGLGSVVTGKEQQIKISMAEHKVAVAEILRAIAIG